MASSSPTPNPSAPPVQILYAVPVGAVIAWCPPDPKATIAPGFMLCDGSVVTDAESPFNSRSVPDLRLRFILGAGEGAPAGAVIGDTGLNTNGYQNAAIATTPTTASLSDNQLNVIIQHQQPTASWRYDLTSDDLDWNDGNHHHDILPATIDIPAPGSIALVYIIRIK